MDCFMNWNQGGGESMNLFTSNQNLIYTNPGWIPQQWAPSLFPKLQTSFWQNLKCYTLLTQDVFQPCFSVVHQKRVWWNKCSSIFINTADHTCCVRACKSLNTLMSQVYFLLFSAYKHSSPTLGCERCQNGVNHTVVQTLNLCIHWWTTEAAAAATA